MPRRPRIAGLTRLALSAVAGVALAATIHTTVQAQANRPAATPMPPAPPADAQPAAPAKPEDLAFGAYQRGYFLTAFNEATRLATQNNVNAMALLGELYANGFGVGRNDEKAAQWYKLAADRGDREAMFALALFRFQGRGGPRDPAAGAKLFEQAANRGHISAAYNLGLLYLQGEQVAQDFKRAAELFQIGARAGSPEAQYALATLYKNGSGVPKNEDEAMRLMGQAAMSGNLDAMVEFAIAQFNGSHTRKDEAAAALMFEKAAKRGSAIAQNRLARILSAGKGAPADPVQAIKWHIVSKAGGASDPEMDIYVSKQKPSDREKAEAAAKKWLASAPELRP